jgi:hypothetical protein
MKTLLNFGFDEGFNLKKRTFHREFENFQKYLFENVKKYHPKIMQYPPPELGRVYI